MPYLAIALGVAAVAAVIACFVVNERRRAAAAERDRLAAEAADRSRAFDALAAQAEALRRDVADRDQQIGARNVEIAELRTKIGGIDEKFAKLAADMLKQAREQLVEHNKQLGESQRKSAEQELDQRKQAIDALLRPIRESLDKHAQAVGQIEKDREGAYKGLRELMAGVVTDQKALRSETANLVKALRRPDVRGRWGEMQLRRVAELSGMIDRCDFSEQPAVTGSLRPDMVVHLPAGREVVVDAKTPIDAYLSALEAPDDAQRDEQFARYVKHVRGKVDELSSKAYAAELGRSVDFVVMFIPGESFLQAAIQRDPELLERAFNRNVVIATPSTLIALLKAVAAGWREEQVAENARHIADLGQELHKRIGTAVEHLGRLGNAVESTVRHYNALVGSVESSVMPQTRKFEELGAKSQKELPVEAKVIETAPRELRSAAPS